MSAYQVNKLCHRLYHDQPFRDAVKADPAKAIADWPLSAAERKALLEGDIKRLYEFGRAPIPAWPHYALGFVRDHAGGVRRPHQGRQGPRLMMSRSKVNVRGGHSNKQNDLI